MATLAGGGSKLPELPKVEKISPSIVRVLGGNGGKFTLQGTNTYLLGTSSDAVILIDTAQGFPQWREQLSSYLQAHNLKIKTGILTHWHGDHVGGVSDLLQISPGVQLYKNQTNQLDPDSKLTAFTVNNISDGQRFSDGQGFEIEAVHCPGHTKDHMGFIVTQSNHAEEVGRIFTGDNILGHGTAVFEDLATYLHSLEVMKNRVVTQYQQTHAGGAEAPTNPIKAYPAHGAVIDDIITKIEEYIKHRKTREDEAINVLRYGTVKKPDDTSNSTPTSTSTTNTRSTVTEGERDKAQDQAKAKVKAQEWDSWDMVKVIYKEIPENLHLPAQKGLLMVLEKLKGEGRVIQTENGLWRLNERSIL